MAFCKVTHTLHVCLSFMKACYERYNAIVDVSRDILLGLQSKRICPPSLLSPFCFPFESLSSLMFWPNGSDRNIVSSLLFFPAVFQSHAGVFPSQAKTVSSSDHLQNITVVAGAIFQTRQPRLRLIIYSTLAELINVVSPLNIS